MSNTEFLTATGYHQWDVPLGVVAVQVECIGNGSDGSAIHSFSGSGGGGGYSKVNNLIVSPGSTCYYFIGPGDGSSPTWFNNTSNTLPTLVTNGVLAENASGSSGGSISDAIGDVKYSGGRASGAGNYCGTYNTYPGAGGAGGPYGNGGDGFEGVCGSGGTGGTGDAGYGGAGGTSDSVNGGNGSEWGSYGSGGGGHGPNSSTGAGSGGFYGGGGATLGGLGRQGLIVLTYTIILYRSFMPIFCLGLQ